MTALELADELQDRVKPYAGSEHWDDLDAAAHELRRLHHANRELLDALSGMLEVFGDEFGIGESDACDEARAAIAKHGEQT